MAAIENSIQLKKHIMELKYKAFEYEEEIGHGLKEISFQLHPSSILHRLLNDLKGNSEVKGDLMSMGRDAALNIVLSTVFGRGKIKGAIFSVVAKKLISFFINKRQKQKEISLSRAS